MSRLVRLMLILLVAALGLSIYKGLASPPGRGGGVAADVGGGADDHSADSAGTRPIAFTQASKGLPKHTVSIHGTEVTFAVTADSHIALILGHIKRELHGYAIMKDAIEHTRKQGGLPIVVDVGSNHGLYALYAAQLGATVVAVEPQAKLCKVINYAASLNGRAVAERITLYNNAVLEKAELIDMSLSDVAEGAIATVSRGKSGGGSVQALPISVLAPPSLGRISFLKVDVEGFELHAVASAFPLFRSKRVDHAFVEFGPPSRWAGAKQSEQDGLTLLKQLSAPEFGLEPRLCESYAWNAVLKEAQKAESAGAYLEALRVKSSRGTYLPLSDPKLWPAFMKGMSACKHCEAELWLALTPKEPAGSGAVYPTFGELKPCVRDKPGDSPLKHRKPCFVRDLGDGLQTHAESEEEH